MLCPRNAARRTGANWGIRSASSRRAIARRRKAQRRTDQFGRTRQRRSRGVQMTVATHEQRQALNLCRKYRLEKRFQVPSLHKHGVESTFAKALANPWRIAAREAVKCWPRCDIAQELMSVSGKQADIPVELDTEPGLRLIGGRRAMREKDNKIEPLRQRAKERRIILDWV